MDTTTSTHDDDRHSTAAEVIDTAADLEDRGRRRPSKDAVVDTVVTGAASVAVGGAALWFLAPICFVC